MYKIKLIRGHSYNGYGVKVKAEQPFVNVEDKETVDLLMETGRFELVEVADGNGKEPDSGEDVVEKSVDKMNETELDAYATENGIDLTGLKKKAEKLAKIQQTVADGNGKEPDFNDGNE